MKQIDTFDHTFNYSCLGNKLVVIVLCLVLIFFGNDRLVKTIVRDCLLTNVKQSSPNQLISELIIILHTSFDTL